MKTDTIIAHKVRNDVSRIANIKNIIAVTSGKGGVGKSTVAVNLAIALGVTGAKVGLLDADIYGPSIPRLMGNADFKPDVSDSKFVPLTKYGIKVMSFGFLVAESQPALWRGAIVVKALSQMLYDSLWEELDYLIIDMPPGTGDIHLTMCQKMPITAVVTVTTPQDIALIDVTKSIEMFNKMNIPCLGIVENMSTHICSQCGHVEAIFGNGGGENLAKKYDLNILAKIPLNMAISSSCEAGLPIALDQHNSLALIYADVADQVKSTLARLPADNSLAIKQTIQKLID